MSIKIHGIEETFIKQTCGPTASTTRRTLDFVDTSTLTHRFVFLRSMSSRRFRAAGLEKPFDRAEYEEEDMVD